MSTKLRKGKQSHRVPAEQVWSDVEEHYIPRYEPPPMERLVYLHLLRRTRVRGVRKLYLSAKKVCREMVVGEDSVRNSLRRLLQRGALECIDHSHFGQIVEVRTPREIPGCVEERPDRELDELRKINCFRRGMWRIAIYRREKYRCFYCRHKLTDHGRTIDHVIPRSKGGSNAFDNVVACCRLCNMAKRERRADAFLRDLRRQGVIHHTVYLSRLAALRRLQAGELRPQLPAAA